MMLVQSLLVCGFVLALQLTEAKVLNSCECGHSNNPLVQRIVGGNTTQPHQYPWVVRLGLQSRDVNGKLWESFCTASIISDRSILTAGHCLLNRKASLITIWIGLQNQIKHDGQAYEADTYTIHPNYEKLSNHAIHDFAIVRTKKRIQFGKWVRPICLPKAGDASYGHRPAVVAGWGFLDTHFHLPDALQSEHLQILSQNECSSSFGGLFTANLEICAFTANKGICQGDSGGPLMVQTQFNRFQQIGVTAWAVSCGEYPSVFASVKAVLPWLQQQIAADNVCQDSASK